MDSANYEPHTHIDSSFPIIFHQDHMIKYGKRFWAHWHENLEILYITNGTVSIMSDANTITANKDDIVIINSNNMHTIHSLSESSRYYCIIIDKKFCSEFGLYIEEIVFQCHISDEKAGIKYLSIVNELTIQNTLYKACVKALITDFLIYLYRNFKLSETALSNKQENIKIESVKKSIKYIQENYEKNLSIDDIAKKIGLSKFYLCRIFKEITGNTIILYINLIRCSNAKQLLQSGKYTVSEAAFLCGFDNLSYFSKTYKKHIGCLPSVSKVLNK